MKTIDFSRFKNSKELQEFAEGLFVQVSLLQNENKDLVEKVNHLEKLLKDSNIPSVEKKNQEEELLLREIDYMDKLSKQGGLSLDETKQLKMLVDCLVGIRRVEKGLDDKTTKKIKKQDPAKLLQIIKESKNE